MSLEVLLLAEKEAEAEKQEAATGDHSCHQIIFSLQLQFSSFPDSCH